MQLNEAFALFKNLERASKDPTLPTGVREDATLAWNSLGEALMAEGLTTDDLGRDSLDAQPDDPLPQDEDDAQLELPAKPQIKIAAADNGGYDVTPKTPASAPAALTVQAILDAATKHDVGPLAGELLALAVRVGELERKR